MDTNIENDDAAKILRIFKILKAREVQKSRIDRAGEQAQQQEERIQRLQRPVVQSLEKLKEQPVIIQQPAIQQQPPLPILLPPQEVQQPVEQQQEEEQLVEEEQQQTEEPVVVGADNIIQQLYHGARKQPPVVNTQFEINPNNALLGQRGRVDLGKLYNEGSFKMQNLGSGLFTFLPKNKITPGLAALLILPYADIKVSKVKPTKKDIATYNDIMAFAGYIGNRASKYRQYIKPYLDLSGQQEEEEESPAENTEEEERDLTTGAIKKKKIAQPERTYFGRGGTFYYSRPEELKHRFQLLTSAVRAGNNSNQIAQELSAVLDELKRTGMMGRELHKQAYLRYFRRPDYRYHFPPNNPLVLGDNPEIGLKNLFLWYTYPNIAERYDNNRVRLKSPGQPWTSVEIPTGMYEVATLSTFLDSKAKGIVTSNVISDLDKEEKKSLVELTINPATFKCSVKIAKEGWELDFGEGKLHQLLGLEAKIYREPEEEGPQYINITRGLDKVLLRCSLVDRKEQLEYKDVLYDVLPYAEPGAAIQQEIEEVEYYPCKDKVIHQLDISITDTVGELLELTEPMSIKLVFKS